MASRWSTRPVRAGYAALEQDLHEGDGPERPFQYQVLSLVMEEAERASGRWCGVNDRAIIADAFRSELRPMLLAERFVRTATSLVIILGVLGTLNRGLPPSPPSSGRANPSISPINVMSWSAGPFWTNQASSKPQNSAGPRRPSGGSQRTTFAPCSRTMAFSCSPSRSNAALLIPDTRTAMVLPSGSGRTRRRSVGVMGSWSCGLSRQAEASGAPRRRLAREELPNLQSSVVATMPQIQ